MRILYSMAKSLKRSVKKSVKNKSRRTKNRFSRKVGKRRGGGEEGEAALEKPKIPDSNGDLRVDENNGIKKYYLDVDGETYQYTGETKEVKNEEGKVTNIKPNNSKGIQTMISKDGKTIIGSFNDDGIPDGHFTIQGSGSEGSYVIFKNGLHYYRRIPYLPFFQNNPNKDRRILWYK